jgi:hypothetical protein
VHNTLAANSTEAARAVSKPNETERLRPIHCHLRTSAVSMLIHPGPQRLWLLDAEVHFAKDEGVKLDSPILRLDWLAWLISCNTMSPGSGYGLSHHVNGHVHMPFHLLTLQWMVASSTPSRLGLYVQRREGVAGHHRPRHLRGSSRISFCSAANA